MTAMRRLAIAGALVVVLATVLAAQAPADIRRRIRDEIGQRSQILPTLHVLTDRYGPRVTGSPNAKAAAEWAVKTMGEWGLVNGHLEPWDFGRTGWTNDFLSVHMTAPVKDALTVEALGWTPGTRGVVRAQALALDLPDQPTPETLDTYLNRLGSAVGGRIVLATRPIVVPVTLQPRSPRQDDARLRTLFDPNGPPAAPPAPGPREARPPMTAAQVQRRVDEFLLSHGAVVSVRDAGRELGQIAAFSHSAYDVTRAVPTVVMRNEDYGRIWRLLADKTPVELEVQMVNTVHPDGKTAYNAIAEIRGTDKADEVVMIGGHLDSWHAATGATDNAIGCAVMMEAARTLLALGVRPRRTIRVALWSGEEQGLLGSQAYVREHFGSAEKPKPAYGALSAYLNLDTGTGRIRGANVFGPAAAAGVIRAALAPLADLGVVGAAANARRVLGGTDSTSFNVAGLPGINFTQDPIQYEPTTHHTNVDTYERVIDEDVRAAAIVVASTVYELAMQESRLPRFEAATMPKVP